MEKNTGLAKFESNFMGFAVSYFERFCTSRIDFFVKPSQSVDSLSRNLKSLGLAEKNAGLAVSQSLEFTIRHSYM